MAAGDADGWTALIAGAASGHVEVIKTLLVHADIDVNKANRDNETALMRAVLASRDLLEAAGAVLPGVTWHRDRMRAALRGSRT